MFTAKELKNNQLQPSISQFHRYFRINTTSDTSATAWSLTTNSRYLPVFQSLVISISISFSNLELLYIFLRVKRIVVDRRNVESTSGPINFLQFAGNIIRRRETSKTHEFAKCNRSKRGVSSGHGIQHGFRALPPAVFAPGQGARHSAGIMYRHRTWPCSHSRASSVSRPP